jgi:hypothetical protein
LPRLPAAEAPVRGLPTVTAAPAGAAQSKPATNRPAIPHPSFTARVYALEGG